MQHTKISCQQCPSCQACSLKTKMFVNYCGSREGTVEENIKNAVAECRSKAGHVMRYNVVSSIPRSRLRALAV